MQPRGPGRLGTDDFRGLDLPGAIRRTDGHLVFAWPARTPGVGPDHPGIGREWGFNVGLAPGLGTVQADFDLGDGMRPAERDASEGVLRPPEPLEMPRTINSGEDLDRPLVGPPPPLPVALVVPVVDLDLSDPFHVLDPVEARHDEAQGEAVRFGKLLAVHEVGEHDIVLHRP